MKTRKLVAEIKNQRIFVEEYHGENLYFVNDGDNEQAYSAFIASFAQAVVTACNKLELIEYHK